MEKDIGRIKKNDTADIIIRVDDFGGQRGLTIREFVTSERYTGFTKAGVRISAGNFPKFREMINSVSEEEMNEAPEQPESQETLEKGRPKKGRVAKESQEEMPDY